MTPNHSDSNHSPIDSSDQSSPTGRMLANLDPGVSRRDLSAWLPHPC